MAQFLPNYFVVVVAKVVAVQTDSNMKCMSISQFSYHGTTLPVSSSAAGLKHVSDECITSIGENGVGVEEVFF